MPLLVLLFLVVCFASWTPTEGRVIRKRAAFYIANETMCIVDGDVFLNGNPVPTDDECEKCTCRPPGFSCVLRDCDTKPGCKAVRRAGECCPEYVCGCIHNNRVYEDGEVIRDLQNACYTCRCHGSSISCTFADCLFRGDCPPEYVQGECCPRYDHCPPIKTTSTTPISTIFTTQSTTTTTTARTSPIVQQEEHFINLTTQHLEKFTDADTTVHIEDIQHGSTSIFTTSSYFTTTPEESVTVKFTLTEGRITSIHDYDFTTLSSILPLQTGTYTETTRYAVPDDTHGRLTTTTSIPPVASDASTTTQHTESDLTTTTHQTSVEGDLPTTTQHPPADDDVLTTTQQHIDESKPSTTTQQSSTEYGLLTSTHQSAGEELLSKTTAQPFAEGEPSTTTHQSLVEDSSLTTTHAEKSLSTTTQQSTTEDLEPLPTSTQQHDTDHTTAQTYVDIFTHSSTIDRHASSSAIEDMSLESSTADISGASQSPESTTESIVDGVYQSNKTTETVDEDYETSSFNDLDTSTQSSHDSTSHYITGDPSEIASTNYETPYTGSADVFHEISINDTNVALFSSTSTVSESSTTYETTSVASKVTSESSTLNYDAIKFTTPSVPSEDNDKITEAHLSTSTIVSAEISSVDEEESISNTLDAFSESDFSGHDDIAPSSNPASSESTTSKDYPDSSTVYQDVSNTVSESSTTEEKSFSFSTDSFEGSTTGNDFSATLTSKTQSEDFDVDNESSSASSSEFFSEKDEHSFKTTALPIEKSSFSETADLQTEESFNVHDLSAKYTTLKPVGTNSEIDSSTEDTGSATTHKTEMLTDNIEISTLLTGNGLKTSTVTVFSDDYSGVSDLVDSQTRVTDNGYDVKEFSISTNAPTETINVTETHYPSSTHFNFEETISPEHIAEISSISTIETFSNEKEIPTGKPTDLLELTPSTEKPLHESSMEDKTINAESDKTSNVPDSIITSSTAGESSNSNENDVHFESSTYTKEQYFFGTHEETVNAEHTEQTSEILDEDMKGTSISSVGTESFTYKDPQTKDQSSVTKSVETITDASSTFTTTSVRHNESSHLTTIESNLVIESETTTHTPLQMNELSTHDSENDRTVTTFESQTENSLKYSTESQTNNVKNELLGISDTSETLGSKIPDKESTNEQSSSVITVNSGAALITNKTEVDELYFDINESEMQKHLNASSHLEESGSGETNGTDNNTLDIQYSSLPEQYISTTTTSEKVIEESITTHSDEYHAINAQNEHDLNKIAKPDEKHNLNEHTTSSDKLLEVTSTDISISPVKPTIIHDLTTGYIPTEEELKHNVTAFQAVSDLVTTESAESLNNADNSLSRNPLISNTGSPNYLEESIVTEGFENKNNEEYYKISTTKSPIDETEYTAEKTTEGPPDPEILQTKSSMTISTDINDKTNTDLVTLHPLKTDLSGLLSVNNKPLQTTELPKPTEEVNEHSTGKVEDGTTISYNKQTEYASSEASTSVLDENESHIVLTNLEVEISSNPISSDNQEESITTEDFSEHVTTEESNISTENAHNLSLPQLTSGIPGEGLFTKQNLKFNESTSYPNYVEEFTETELNENNLNATDSDAKINGPNVSTEYSIAYDIADAEEITVLDPLPNNSSQEENIPTENSKNVLNKTSTEFEGLITESNSIPQEINTNSIIYDELLLNNEQDSEHLTPPQANETNFANAVDLLVSTNSSLSTTHSEFDDYSVLDAEDDVNDTLLSQEVHSGSDKNALLVESNSTSEKIPYMNVPIESFQLDGNEDGTKIKNVSAILSSANAELPEEENESVVTEPNIVSSPDVYHTEAISLGEDVRTTVISDNTTLELELVENLKTNSPKEENMEKTNNTHESGISTSSSYPSEYETNKNSFISTASSEGEITSSSDIYESTHFSTLQPPYSTEFVSTISFPDDVKISSDKQQFNGSTAVSDLGEDIEITSDAEHGYSLTMISTIKEHEKENQHTQFYKPATEESVSQTETVFVRESTADIDSGKSTPFEPENYISENSAPVVEDNTELITYNNHRGKEQELTSVQHSETTTRNQVNILFGQITDRFSTVDKSQLDSVTSVTDLIQPQTEGDELAESHITIDENNFGVALHEIGDAPTIKPDVVESISEVTTTKQPEIHDHIDDLYENEYDSEEDTHELIQNSQPTVKSSSTSYEEGNSSDVDTVEDNTTTSIDNFSVLGYLGNLFSSSTTSDSTDVVSTESVVSSQEHHLEIGESAEHLVIDAVASSESNYDQFTTVNLSSNKTENNFNSGSTNGEYSDINNTVETDLLTESNSNASPIHENSTYVNQDNSQTTEKASENTENSNTKVDVSLEEEDSKVKIVQNNSPEEQNYSNDQTTSTKFEPNLSQKYYENNESTTSNTSPANFNGAEVSTTVAENSKHDKEFSSATTLALYVFNRGKNNDTAANSSEEMATIESDINRNPDIPYDTNELQSTYSIPIESTEYISSVQDPTNSQKDINDPKYESSHKNRDNVTTSLDNPTYSELPEKHENSFTSQGIVSDIQKPFQPYSLYDVISNVFKAPGYDVEVQEQAGVANKQNPAGVVKRDTNQRGERQISTIYEAAISDAKNLQPLPRRLQEKTVPSRGVGFSRNLRQNLPQSQPNPQPQQQDPEQPAFASVTSSFIIVDRADEGFRSRRKIPIRNPDGEIQEIEVPADFKFSPPPFRRFPSKSVTENEKNH